MADGWRVGDVVDDRYEVLGVAGRGGMGVVHRVRHREWGVDLAVKSLRPDLSRRADLRDRFVAEAEAWVSLGLHPHVCCCHYVRTLDGVPRLFAEYVPGGSLADRVADRTLYAGPAPLATVLDVAVQVAWGLAYAHDRGLVHRDVKPANVLLDVDGVAKLADFGLARVRPAAPAPGPDGAPGASVPVPGGGGTRVYAAPEQAAGRPVGRRADVYSFAVSVLELCVGEVRWLAGSAARDVLDTVRDGRVAPPPELADLLRRCLDPDPERRPASMDVVAADLTDLYARLVGRPYPRVRPATAHLRADELNNRALSLADLGRSGPAEEAFAAALAADPQHLAAAYNLGLVRWRTGATGDTDLVARLTGADDGSPQERYLLAQVHLERGDLDAARALLTPDEDRPEVRAALDVLRSGRIADARRVDEWRLPPVPGGSVLDLLGRGRPFRFAAEEDVALVADADRTVRLWDLAERACRRTLTGHAVAVRAVDVTADGRYGVSADESGTVIVWDLTDGTRVRTLTAPAPRPPQHHHRHTVRLTAGARFVLWSAGTTVELWDVRDGTRRTLHRGYGGIAVDVTPDGRYAALVEYDEVRVWDLTADRSWRHPERDMPGSAVALRLSADGRYAAIGTDRGAVRLWDLRAGRCTRVLTGHEEPVDRLAFSSDGTRLVSAEGDAIRCWTLATGRCLRTYPWPADGLSVWDLRIDGDTAVTAGGEGGLRRWRLPTDSHVAAPRLSRPRPPVEVAGTHAAAESGLADAARALAAGRYPAAHAALTAVRAVPGYERAPRVLSAWRDLTAVSVRVAPRDAWRTATLDTGDLYAADLSADGRTVVTGGHGGVVGVWDAVTGERVRELAPPSPPAHVAPDVTVAVGLDADARTVASVGRGGGLRLWSVADGARLGGTTVGGDDLRSVRLAHGGTALVGTRGGVLRAWDAAAGRPLWTLDSPDGSGVADVSVSAGDRAAAVWYQGIVRVVDVRAGRVLHTVETGQPHVVAVALATDGRRLLTVGGESFDRFIQLWDVATGSCLRVFDWEQALSTRTVRWTADGRFAVSADEQGRIRVWDVATGTILRTLDTNRSEPRGVAVSGDGRVVLWWNAEGAQLWELDWDLDAREPADWDDGATPYLAAFLDRYGRDEFTADDVEALLRLLRHAGYGWLRADAVRGHAYRMAERPVP
ncbi:hypothetical protein GCM10022220_37690 [Actinocatenispora rupis]|uniref:WD40 repeat domain-containing serine/threonine protein kinase n=1 Tax=Actinocatenispora rupis TaxID=519421 RepID=UPI0031F14D04